MNPSLVAFQFPAVEPQKVLRALAEALSKPLKSLEESPRLRLHTASGHVFCGRFLGIGSGREETALLLAEADDGDGVSYIPLASVTGLTVQDIDLWEINEAFAVVAEKFIRDLKLDRDKVNVNGGAIALGHPIGATGSILIGTLLDELERRDLKRGLATMCAGGGMAPAIIIERI